MAINRVTQAADTVADVSALFEENLNVKQGSTHASSRAIDDEDSQEELWVPYKFPQHLEMLVCWKQWVLLFLRKSNC